MEIAAAVLVPAVENASPIVANRWRYHRDIHKNMETLREASEKLNRRKVDMKKRLENEVEYGETEEVEEVKFWLERVEKIHNEVEEIGRKVARVKFFSRAGLGRKVVEMIPKVDRLYEEGAFGDGSSMVRKLPQRGSEKPTTMILGGETRTENTRDEILGCLIDKKVTKIGVYGMGGLGKTTVLEHVHNIMLKEDGDEIGRQFDKVIWITVSKDSNVKVIQDKLAREFGISTLNDNDEEECRAKLVYKEFNKRNNKRHLLIIDDLWEAYPLQKVGVPEPTFENGCKLVITTRSRDVCSKMKCDWIIGMGLLSEEEAVNLFLDRVGQSVSSDPNLVEMAKQVARECAGLPLAIVTVAASLRDKTDSIEWEVALTELKDATSSVSSEITTILRFSYDRLKDEKLKECLLYCGLYSEDYLIEETLLIDQLIAEGILERTKPWKYKMAKGHVMLNELVSNCLLINAVNHDHKKCVKLHDSVRDMAICIMHESPRFFVKVGGESDSMSSEDKLDELVEKVSFMGNKIKEIPFVEPPNCPRLSTLFLGNSGLEYIAEDFFTQMEGLRVLDLSWMYIQSLPSSISSLTKLEILLLNNTCLEFIPDLSNLTNLTRLDLLGTIIQEVPQGVEKLTKLMYLHLPEIWMNYLPDMLLGNLSDLRSLSIIFGHETNLLSHAKDFGSLKKLNTLRIQCLSLHFFNTCVKSIFNGGLKLENFKFMLGFEFGFFEEHNPNSVTLECSDILSEEDNPDLPISLPENVESLTIRSGFHVSSFSRLVSIENIANLQRLTVVESFDISEFLFCYSPTVFPLLQKIEELELHRMRGLRGIVSPVEGNKTISLQAFSSLKKLIVKNCENMETLFVMDKDSLLLSLEDIEICECDNLEEIMINGSEDAIMTLPSLKKLNLSDLPKLKSVPFIADSLSKVSISNCESLIKVTFMETKPYPSSLQRVCIDKEPWESLAKEHMISLSL